MTELQLIKKERDDLLAQVKDLKTQLAAAVQAKQEEQDLRLSLEEQIASDLDAAQKAMGHAALRMLSLLDRVSPE